MFRCHRSCSQQFPSLHHIVVWHKPGRGILSMCWLHSYGESCKAKWTMEVTFSKKLENQEIIVILWLQLCFAALWMILFLSHTVWSLISSHVWAMLPIWINDNTVVIEAWSMKLWCNCFHRWICLFWGGLFYLSVISKI